MTHSPHSQKKNAAGGAIGNVLEWYDFAIFGFLAPIMSPLFFPGSDPIAGLIKTYGVFAGGYLMRPFGGMLFGYIGDRLGRTRALKLSIAMMAIPTVLVGVLPTHDQVGAWAAALLILLRLAQGVSVGGELVGSITYLVEQAPKGKKGFNGSWSLFGAALGVLLGSLVVSFLSGQLSAEQMSVWGWRVAFFSGAILFIAGLWLRSDMDAVPSATHTSSSTQQNPVLSALMNHPARLFHLACVLLLYAGGFYTLFVWMPTYLGSLLSTPIAHADQVTSLSLVALIIAIPLWGWLSDRVGFKPVALFGMVGFTALVYPVFVFIDHGIFVQAVAGTVLLAMTFAAIQAPMAALLVAAVPADSRASSIGIAYNLTLGLFGGTAPMVNTWLIHQSGDLASPAFYLAILGILSIIGTISLRIQRD